MGSHSACNIRGMEQPEFARVSSGRDHWSPGERIARHRHRQAYAAIVLSGSYEECGSAGRFRVKPGDVLIHPPFDAHLDRFSSAGACILNLSLPATTGPQTAGRITDPDEIVRAAEQDLEAARESLRRQMRSLEAQPMDWPDALALRLRRDPSCRLDAWAHGQGLSKEALSRGFVMVFGITPTAFRAESKVQQALALMAEGTQPLTSIALAAGFADQAHMTRAVRTVTGEPPTRLLRSIGFKTARAAG